MKRVRILWIIVCLFVLFFSSVIIFINVDESHSILSIPKSTHDHSKSKTHGTYLAVVIPSAAKNLEKRKTIRNTWLNLSGSNTKHVFVIGGKNSNYDTTALQAEILAYQDILYLENVSDSYDTLTEKLLQSFVKLNEIWNFKFLLKCDDDSFARVPNIVDELREKYDYLTTLYWGFFDGSAHIKKKGRWKETNWILCDRYLPYALGGGYVLSQALVQFIADNHKYLNIYKTEDVAVGSWLSPLNITRVHDPRFDTEYVSRGCSNTYLVTHKHSPDSMKNLHQSLTSTGKLCGTEFQARLSYVYDWEAPPSKCCHRFNISIP